MSEIALGTSQWAVSCDQTLKEGVAGTRGSPSASAPSAAGSPGQAKLVNSGKHGEFLSENVLPTAVMAVTTSQATASRANSAPIAKGGARRVMKMQVRPVPTLARAAEVYSAPAGFSGIRIKAVIKGAAVGGARLGTSQAIPASPTAGGASIEAELRANGTRMPSGSKKPNNIKALGSAEKTALSHSNHTAASPYKPLSCALAVPTTPFTDSRISAKRKGKSSSTNKKAAPSSDKQPTKLAVAAFDSAGSVFTGQEKQDSERDTTPAAIAARLAEALKEKESLAASAAASRAELDALRARINESGVTLEQLLLTHAKVVESGPAFDDAVAKLVGIRAGMYPLQGVAIGCSSK